MDAVFQGPNDRLRETVPSVALCCLGAWLIVASTAQADNIDEALLRRHASDVIDYVQENGYQNVGILSFQLKKGNQPASFHGGLICDNLPERLAHTMALKMDAQAPEFNLLRDAAEIAREKIPHASYRTRADRRKLFAIDYPLLWGASSSRARPDVLLAGLVTLSPDLRRTRIAIGAMTEERMEDVLEFEVATDTSILADVGEGFSVSKSNRKLLRGFVDEAALDDTGFEPADDRKKNGTSTRTPVRMTIYYDGKKQHLEAALEAVGNNGFTVAEPEEGQEITIGLENEDDGKVGVVLTVNGVSTLHEEQGDAANLKKWVLEPHREYLVKGFHQEDHDTYYTIRALSEKQSEERFDDLGGEQFAGLIHLHVFCPVDSDEAVTPAFTRSIGRLSLSEKRDTSFTSLRDLQMTVLRKSTLHPEGTKPLFGWGEEKSEQLEELELGDVRHLTTMIVRYYEQP